VQNATSEIFGEPISDNIVAIKYSELMQAQREPPDVAKVDQYWRDERLLRLANALWEALKLPMRGDVSGIPLAG
jgi:hypothetical protein